MADDKYYCKNCNSTKSADNFYLSNNLEKYPDGKVNLCKKCMTLHVDNWDPQTYLWILQEIDVPYIPEEWNKLLANYGKDRSKVTGLTILGRYLSKMKLKQYRDFRWDDTDHLQELANNKIEQTMKRQGYGAVEIAEAINKATFTLPEDIAAPPPESFHPQEENYGPIEDYFDDGATDALVAELTEEDRLYLRLKWGKAYKPDEWIELEKLYQEMMESYDIQTAGHKDTLKLICKTSLKANQLIDMGDIEGYQKMSKVYDSLMKAGKFTAAQNKAENGEYVDSVAELIALCERDGFIPRYYVDGPQDKVDRVIQDLEDYTRNLVLEELHLGPLIEKAIRNNMDDADKEDEDEEDEDAELERSLYEDENTTIEDDDYDEFFEQQDELKKQDETLYTLM
jgi:hypothetical protein